MRHARDTDLPLTVDRTASTGLGDQLVRQIREERDVILTGALAALDDQQREAIAAAGPALQALRDQLDNHPVSHPARPASA